MRPFKSIYLFGLQRPALTHGLILGFLVLLPLLLKLTGQKGYWLDVAITTLLYIMLALGLNIVVGLAGLLDLGYIAFYAVGAYSAAILTTRFGWPIWGAFPVGMGAAVVAGIALGFPTLRLRGDYLAIVTLGFGEIIRIALNNLDALTNGPKGISGVAKPILFGTELRQMDYLYYMALVLLVLTYWMIYNLQHSALGRAWVAIRENEMAAAAMGVNTTRTKLLAFALGASFAGLAGVFFASKMGFVSPESFTLMESVIVVAMVVLGGIGNLPGVILGAVLLALLPEILRELPSLLHLSNMSSTFDLNQYRMLIFGATMVMIMLLRPRGLLGHLPPHHASE